MSIEVKEIWLLIVARPRLTILPNRKTPLKSLTAHPLSFRQMTSSLLNTRAKGFSASKIILLIVFKANSFHGELNQPATRKYKRTLIAAQKWPVRSGHPRNDRRNSVFSIIVHIVKQKSIQPGWIHCEIIVKTELILFMTNTTNGRLTNNSRSSSSSQH